ncbi:DUF1697 domain-containing protein [Sphingomonas qilianensis]|uniref:DUF1697 domain-containing protein n=1 Tax=Sphingomonas qilianensis TaxID=1736690 RepID=A0ABU9XWC1_9SPHN
MRWAALLKGVNVGGNRKLPMADLKMLIESLGYTAVKTLLASGNVVFSCDESDGAVIEAGLEQALTTLGLTTDVLVRNQADIEGILTANPFPDAATDHPSHYVVAFHRDPVPDGLIARVPELYQGPERMAAIGRELYVDYADNIGESKLPQAMAKLKFPKLATARNWNTVLKLRALLA